MEKWVAGSTYLSANQDNLKVTDFCLKETITTKPMGAALVTRPLQHRVSQMLMEQHTSPAFLRRGGEGLARAKGFPGGCGDSPRCKRH